MVCYDRTIFENLESGGAKKLNIEKIAFKVAQMKILAMHILLIKFLVLIYLRYNIFMEHDLNILMTFLHKRKIDHFDPYSVFWLFLQITCAAYDCFCAQGTHM